MGERIAAVITGTGEVATRVEPIPELKDGQVLIKVHASLISPGTEMKGVRSKREAPDPKAEATTFGYANAGEVVAVKGRTGFEPGMRVAAMGGGYALHANYACVPMNLVVPLPDAVDFEDAAYACLGATALQAVRRAGPALGEFGAILGQGIVGNLAAQFAQLSGARVIAWEGFAERIAISRGCGVKRHVDFREQDAAAATRDFASPYGLDFAVFAFGGEATEAFEQVMGCMKRAPDTHQMGRIVLVGGCVVRMRGGSSSGNVDVRASSRTGPGYHDEAYEHGADYPAGFVQFTTQRNLREIVRLMAEKRLIVEPMTTHRVPLARVGEMADMLLESPDQALGVILRMEH